MNEEQMTEDKLTKDHWAAGIANASVDFCSPRRPIPAFEKLDAFARGLNVADQSAADLVSCMAHDLRQRIWDLDDESSRLRDQLKKTEALRVDAMHKAQTVLEEGTSIWKAVLRVAELLKVEFPLSEVWDQTLLDNHIQMAIQELQKRNA